jgi:predicted nucleotide-binding protein
MLGRCAELIEKTNEPTRTSKPRVFVGSSVEGLEIARAIQSELQYDYSVEIWNQNTVFGLGTSTIEALEDAVRTYEYAIFVFTPDDLIQRRDKQNAVPRDNVIFEAGLLIGQLTRFRAFVVQPRGRNIQLPTDLSGLTTATYEPDATIIDAAIGPACRQIRLAIQNRG